MIPTAPGYYWCKSERYWDRPRVVYVYEEDDTLKVWTYDRRIVDERLDEAKVEGQLSFGPRVEQPPSAAYSQEV